MSSRNAKFRSRSNSNRRRPRLAIRARYRDVGELVLEARERFAIGAIVIVLVTAAIVVVAMLR